MPVVVCLHRVADLPALAGQLQTPVPHVMLAQVRTLARGLRAALTFNRNVLINEISQAPVCFLRVLAFVCLRSLFSIVMLRDARSALSLFFLEISTPHVTVSPLLYNFFSGDFNVAYHGIVIRDQSLTPSHASLAGV